MRTRTAKSHIQRVRQNLHPASQSNTTNTLPATTNESTALVWALSSTTNPDSQTSYSQVVTGHSMVSQITTTGSNERLQTIDVQDGTITIKKEDLNQLVIKIMNENNTTYITTETAQTLIDTSLPDTSNFVKSTEVSEMITNYALDQDFVTTSTITSVITAAKNSMHTNSKHKN